MGMKAYSLAEPETENATSSDELSGGEFSLFKRHSRLYAETLIPKSPVYGPSESGVKRAEIL